jgi:hypothetical protein
MSDDIDSYFDKFERLGLIYISRNRGMMYIRGTRFWRNIGTFGGAITINSPDWKNGNKPYVVISECIFDNNMAYFSGNAIYIRNTMRMKNLLEVCSGVFIEKSIFNQNIGTKIHNGGAIAAVCTYLDKVEHDDYYATSSMFSVWLPVDLIQDLYEPLNSIIDPSYSFNVFVFKFNIENSNFTENYSGSKGSAVYLK